ncbi:MAG: response regulator transcription factor [Lachnospiraceae bacterium]|nr:response regulator transcription factor [Lachnospiraceae bacterium]
MARIYMIDDDREVLDINMKYLQGCGYEVSGTDNPKSGLQALKKNGADIVILDVMMPGMDGFELCRQLREFSDVPVIFLTGKSNEDDKINALMLGGDDYILKPYSLKELRVRIDVILRRIMNIAQKDTSQKVSQTADSSLNGRSGDSILCIGKLKIDRIGHKVYFDGEEIIFTNREYDVFVYMAENPDRTITFKELGEKVFGTYLDSDRQGIMVIVSRFRKKMKDNIEFSNMIETVWSKGYKFISK